MAGTRNRTDRQSRLDWCYRTVDGINLQSSDPKAPELADLRAFGLAGRSPTMLCIIPTLCSVEIFC
jgi:hypothetical protein